jgi:hypothetical protein
MIETEYSRAVAYVADSVLAQIEDGSAPHRDYNAQCADGAYRPSVRIYFADIPYMGQLCKTMPRGVVRVAIDLDETHRRWPTHEVRVSFDPHDFDAGEAAADIARIVLDQLPATAEIVR